MRLKEQKKAKIQLIKIENRESKYFLPTKNYSTHKWLQPIFNIFIIFMYTLMNWAVLESFMLQKMKSIQNLTGNLMI